MQRLKTGEDNIRRQVFDMLNPPPIITDPEKMKRG